MTGTSSSAILFSPLHLREIKFKNRIFVSPMCQYSALNGIPTNWHLVHLGSRAVGGAALVMAEATAVSPEGRISPGDTGIWNDDQANYFSPITRFIHQQGAVPGIQLAHAGRKASARAPWDGHNPLPHEQAWDPIAPSALPFGSRSPMPQAMNLADIERVVENFKAAASRAVAAGFRVCELHFAHGYLMHEFLSPLTNQRTDDYGGSLENRMRLPLRVAKEVRALWPQEWPVFVRVSATDWVAGAWDLAQTVTLARELQQRGIDLIDCSTGGIQPSVPIPTGPGYQVEFARGVHRETGVATGAVGLITQAKQAEEILQGGEVSAIFLARELLRDPYWPLHAAHELGVDLAWPKQYERAKPELLT